MAAIRLRIFMCQISISDIARHELPDCDYKRTISSVDAEPYLTTPPPVLVDIADYITPLTCCGFVFCRAEWSSPGAWVACG
jgi:hypothetical protein